MLRNSTACCHTVLRHHDDVLCPTVGPYTLPKLVLQTVRYNAFSFNLQYPLFSSRSSSTCLGFHSHLSIAAIFEHRALEGSSYARYDQSS